MILLETHDLVKKYGGRTVVNRVSYNVGQGEIVGLLGRNGAGKTTSFRMTIGMIEPDGGQVIFDGVDVTDLPMYKRARRGIGYLSQEPSIFTRLSARDNLLAILETMPMSRKARGERADELLDHFGLAKVTAQHARTLSGGERRKLEIARALITNPTLILLDEPFSGVDPIAVEELQKEIFKLRLEQGLSFLITDHNVQRTLEVVDRAYIINDGTVLRDGQPKALINDELVRKTYLGNTFQGDEFD